MAKAAKAATVPTSLKTTRSGQEIKTWRREDVKRVFGVIKMVLVL